MYFHDLKKNFLLESNEVRYDAFYHTWKQNNKLQMSKRIQITSENKNSSNVLNQRNFKKIYLIKGSRQKNINKNNINISINENSKQEYDKNNITNIEESNEYYNIISIKCLVNQYFEESKMIIDKDFHIFKFKDIVGHENVLPIMGYVLLRTFGLLDSRIITTKKLDSFLRAVNDNYKISTLYHNSLHGADVTQTICVYFLNSNIEEICETSVLDLLGMIISAMGHDLGHPGLNNNFHINAGTDLAITYNDVSCLENFHTSFLFKILRKEENNILEKLSVANYKSIRKRIISQIIATDMANHGETISSLRSKLKSWKDDGQSIFTLEMKNQNLVNNKYY